MRENGQIIHVEAQCIPSQIYFYDLFLQKVFNNKQNLMN